MSCCEAACNSPLSNFDDVFGLPWELSLLLSFDLVFYDAFWALVLLSTG
jgi:hypothetical protein